MFCKNRILGFYGSKCIFVFSGGRKEKSSIVNVEVSFLSLGFTSMLDMQKFTNFN
jgi:hypothetical protein